MALIRPEELAGRVRHDPKRRAEVKLYDALCAQLGKGWVVFYSVAWLAPTPGGAPRDGETDFIVAHPEKGVLLIEVKGGQIRYDAVRRQWISRDAGGVDHDIDPIEQVRQSKYALRSKLKALNSLRNVYVDLSHAVAFPDVERPRAAVTPDAPPEIFIGADDLERLRERLEAILAYSARGTQRQFQNGDLVIAELTRLLGQSVTLRNPLSREALDEEREMVRLTEEQFSLLDFLSRQPRAAIGGCAGSGKTFLAAEKARRLAQEEFRTLLTCFNRPLADFLQSRVGNLPNLDVMNFHTLADRCARQVGPAPLHDEQDEDACAYRLADAMQRLPHLRYDAIVVDEGQDFRDLWWVALQDCLKDNRKGCFYVFYDDNQVLYRDRGRVPEDLLRYPLTTNLRNTRAIHQFVAPHYHGEEPVGCRGPVGRPVEQHTYRSPEEMHRLLDKTLSRLVNQEGFHPEDLVVLTPYALRRSSLPGARLCPPLALAERQQAQAHQVPYETVYRFKGLERPVAVVVELDESLPSNPQIVESLCYVAFSRPRSHLVLMGTPDVLPRLASGQSPARGATA